MIALLARPECERTATIVIAVNIAVAVPEAFWTQRSIANSLVGATLVAWGLALAAVPPMHEYPKHVVLFVLAYCVWNVWFYTGGHDDLWSAVPQTLVPAFVALWAVAVGRSDPLWLFALLRVSVLLVLCLHVASPLSCHRQYKLE